MLSPRRTGAAVSAAAVVGVAGAAAPPEGVGVGVAVDAGEEPDAAGPEGDAPPPAAAVVGSPAGGDGGTVESDESPDDSPGAVEA